MYQPKSEEEKTQDILFHEMRSDAQDHIDQFFKKASACLLITCIAAVLLFAAMCSFMMAAYDNEKALFACSFGCSICGACYAHLVYCRRNCMPVFIRICSVECDSEQMD